MAKAFSQLVDRDVTARGRVPKGMAFSVERSLLPGEAAQPCHFLDPSCALTHEKVQPVTFTDSATSCQKCGLPLYRQDQSPSRTVVLT